jgi:protein-L-isoaspartate(D-aspartate) O-methyltransferase
MVALMLEELQLLPGQRVLEVGCGSGYNAACIATMLGQTGRLISLEVNQELVEFARANVAKLGLETRIEIHQADGSLGWPPREKREHYDRIAVTAATPEIPKSLVEQLTREGILLVPLGGAPVQVLTRVKKDSDGKIQTESVCDCVFVPL